MTLLQCLSEKESWESFFEYRSSGPGNKRFLAALRAFIDAESYLPVCERIRSGEPFALPVRKEISKLSSKKKRIVYTYPFEENMALKLLTWLILRKYDALFSGNLYSFRPGKNAKNAVRMLKNLPELSAKYSYKVDVSNYFNSIPVDAVCSMVQTAVGDDPALAQFLIRLLREERCVKDGKTIREEKGIMAGTPISTFLANLYLSDLDRHFSGLGATYIRYSDDIIVFADTAEELAGHESFIRAFLAEKKLSVNADKEFHASPGEDLVFLGFEFSGKTIDIAPATVKKMKGKMKRKARGLTRWQMRRGAGGENAAKAFIRVFNRKLFDAPEGSELSWSYWFFPVINTDRRLREIDAYCQNLLRTMISGTNTKARFNVRYDDLKELGYRSVVHEYRKFLQNPADQDN